MEGVPGRKLACNLSDWEQISKNSNAGRGGQGEPKHPNGWICSSFRAVENRCRERDLILGNG